MIKLKGNLVLLLVFFVFGGVAIPVMGQSASGRAEVYVPPKAAEGVDLRLNISEAGEVVSVRITECDGCMPRSFLPARDLEIVVGDETITPGDAAALNGRGGTVLYDRDTGLAETVIFYGQ